MISRGAEPGGSNLAAQLAALYFAQDVPQVVEFA
jgi:hypothetical protein